MRRVLPHHRGRGLAAGVRGVRALRPAARGDHTGRRRGGAHRGRVVSAWPGRRCLAGCVTGPVSPRASSAPAPYQLAALLEAEDVEAARADRARPGRGVGRPHLTLCAPVSGARVQRRGASSDSSESSSYSISSSRPEYRRSRRRPRRRGRRAVVPRTLGRHRRHRRRHRHRRHRRRAVVAAVDVQRRHLAVGVVQRPVVRLEGVGEVLVGGDDRGRRRRAGAFRWPSLEGDGFLLLSAARGSALMALTLPVLGHTCPWPSTSTSSSPSAGRSGAATSGGSGSRSMLSTAAGAGAQRHLLRRANADLVAAPHPAAPVDERVSPHPGPPGPRLGVSPAGLADR